MHSRSDKKIKNSAEDSQSLVAWLAVNEVSKKRSNSKLKSTRKKERKHLLKEHFKNLLGKSPKVTDNPSTKIINNEQEIRLGQFIQEEQKLTTRKLPIFMKYHQKYGRQGYTATPYTTKTQ